MRLYHKSTEKSSAIRHELIIIAEPGKPYTKITFDIDKNLKLVRFFRDEIGDVLVMQPYKEIPVYLLSNLEEAASKFTSDLLQIPNVPIKVAVKEEEPFKITEEFREEYLKDE